jgi:hypothetical protein
MYRPQQNLDWIIKEIELYSECYRTRIRPAFMQMEQEATKIADIEFEKINKLIGPNTDESDAAAQAHQRACDYWVDNSQAKGLTTFTPAFLKSDTLRVTMVRSWTSAVAAIRLSLRGMA